MSEACVTLLGGVLTSDDTFISVKKGQEDETFLNFFPEGFERQDLELKWKWLSIGNEIASEVQLNVN